MANTENKPRVTIGVDMYTFFKVTEDTAEGTTYGEPYSLPGTVQVSPTDSGGSDTFDADNGAYDVESYIENIGHELTNADIPAKVDMMWRGRELKNGVAEVGDVTDPPMFAVAWRLLKMDGSHRYVRYYKGKYSFASNVGGQTKPSSGPSEKQTATATFTAVKRDSDGNYYAYIDEDDIPENAKKDFEEKWFSDPNYYPPGAENLKVSDKAAVTSTTKKEG
ncbi:MAG: hypothetical protein J1G06_04555 [Oscillospiraceae bacterium]|nr:hypothetical protein [Oscillospiraceae bacterium]